MAIVQVNPGVCGFNTTLEVTSADEQMATLRVDTECPHIRAMSDALGEVDAYVECLGKFGAGEIAQAAAVHCRHAACPVPMAMLKGLEVACGLALPRNVTVEPSRS